LQRQELLLSYLSLRDRTAENARSSRQPVVLAAGFLVRGDFIEPVIESPPETAPRWRTLDDHNPLKAPIGLPPTHPPFMHNTSHACRGQEGMVFSMGMNESFTEARRWNKSTAQCFAERWVQLQCCESKLERTFRHRLENRLAEVISDSSNDRNYRVVWFRIEILPTHVAWRPASPSSKGSNPPETHQSGSEQFE